MISETDPLITVRDVVDAGYCVPGIKQWFLDHGMDFRDFVQNGKLKSELLTAVGEDDGLVLRVVESKESREDG